MIPRRADLLADLDQLKAELHAIRSQLELLDRVEALEEELANATIRAEANEQNYNDALAEIEQLKAAAVVAGDRIRELTAEAATLRTERDVALDKQRELADQLAGFAASYVASKKK